MIQQAYELKQLDREMSLRESTIDEDNRTVSLAFSSEEPVERIFGNEVLDHDPESVRLGRLQNAGPLLMDHDTRDHVGVIESASIEQDRTGRAMVRFGKSVRATEVFQDVIDGIRRHISVGYRIYRGLEDSENDEVRVIDWEPMEISLVSVPADATVGIGRSDDFINEFNLERTLQCQKKLTIKKTRRERIQSEILSNPSKFV